MTQRDIFAEVVEGFDALSCEALYQMHRLAKIATAKENA